MITRQMELAYDH